MPTCDHCGTRFAPSTPEERFCCKGCECVYELIHEQGYDRFYDLKKSTALAPLKSRPFETPDLAWFEKRIAEAEAKAGESKQAASLDCALEGLSCVACVWLVERLFEQQPGAIRAVSNPARASLHLEWQPGACDLPHFAHQLISFGYTPAPSVDTSGHRDTSGLAARTGLCGAFALNAMGFSLPTYLGMPDSFEFAALFRLITFLSATLAMLVGGSWFITRAWRALRSRTIHIDLPIALGLVAAYLGSIVGWATGHAALLYFDFVCTFVVLMLGGRWLQTLAVEKNRRRMARRSPVASTVTRGDKQIPLDTLAVGERFEIPPGRALPVAATLVSNSAEVSLEWIHGEPDPVAVAAGNILPAGAILLSRHPAELLARESWQDSLLSRLTAESEAEKGSPGLQRLLRAYLLIVIATGLAGLAFWSLQGNFPTGLQAMISIFVVSCPCALGIAIPLADERAIKLATRAGAFVRRTTLWSRLPKVRQVVFDKTGTLTLERPVLAEPNAVAALDDPAATALALLTSGSCHPVSRTLLEALGPRGQQLLGSTPTAKNSAPPAITLPTITETPGQGVQLQSPAGSWSLGKANWQAQAPAGTTVLALDAKPIATFTFRDTIRPGARNIIAWLHSRKITVHILSGDHPDKVRQMAETLGIDPALAHGGLSPDEKATRIQTLDHLDTLYLGDGANDSLAFDHAFVTGTPVAERSLLEKKSDFYTLGNGLAWLPELFAIARSRTLGIRRAFVFTLIYNTLTVAVCLTGAMNPLLAAILMPLSSISSLILVTFAKLAIPPDSVHGLATENRPTWEKPTTLPSASTSAC